MTYSHPKQRACPRAMLCPTQRGCLPTTALCCQLPRLIQELTSGPDRPQAQRPRTGLDPRTWGAVTSSVSASWPRQTELGNGM